MSFLSSLLASLPVQLTESATWTYMVIYVLCASCVYMVLARRISEKELDRKVVDGVFFTMLGASTLIWILSKIPPIS
ncbi:MAG: hypothetical protein AAF927_05595 [Bacteroidota bacterium]